MLPLEIIHHAQCIMHNHERPQGNAPSLGTVGRCSLSKRNEESKGLGEASLSHIPLPSGGVRGGCQGLGEVSLTYTPTTSIYH